MKARGKYCVRKPTPALHPADAPMLENFGAIAVTSKESFAFNTIEGCNTLMDLRLIIGRSLYGRSELPGDWRFFSIRFQSLDITFQAV